MTVLFRCSYSVTINFKEFCGWVFLPYTLINFSFLALLYFNFNFSFNFVESQQSSELPKTISDRKTNRVLISIIFLFWERKVTILVSRFTLFLQNIPFRNLTLIFLLLAQFYNRGNDSKTYSWNLNKCQAYLGQKCTWIWLGPNGTGCTVSRHPNSSTLNF
jgi:hypothetical protein